MLRVIAERYGMGGCGALELSRLHRRARSAPVRDRYGPC